MSVNYSLSKVWTVQVGASFTLILRDDLREALARLDAEILRYELGTGGRNLVPGLRQARREFVARLKVEELEDQRNGRYELEPEEDGWVYRILDGPLVPVCFDLLGVKRVQEAAAYCREVASKAGPKHAERWNLAAEVNLAVAAELEARVELARLVEEGDHVN